MITQKQATYQTQFKAVFRTRYILIAGSGSFGYGSASNCIKIQMAKRNFINNASINRIHIILDRIISKLGKETNFRNLTGQNAYYALQNFTLSI